MGFGTDHGTVVAASSLGRTAPDRERCARQTFTAMKGICHESGVPAFLLPLREPRREVLRNDLIGRGSSEPSESSIGPRRSCRATTSWPACPAQFDEWIWFDETAALHPLGAGAAEQGLPTTYPFGV